ncbi:MAG: 2-oxoacid:acceptor oxidoreductase family protein [Candidatus Thermoplasmatota archaeon]|jgi:pyruvate ferredoxin oxidoreductase gamma subunit/2-oxoisovalerate ferredoxin oxidoreductase gamma subunit|nr:2-oxoacid:acceptor oxidoreductase family protein [Candidatus Thermoplasmatota archaeon]MCL5785377.1 2-oxoacid:acceptor oxidoreductase family protein [Candidatus Thermoplasmatota archaeon]
MFEVRFHGRGGQGAVTASEILAHAAFNEGKYAVSFPFFGTERRGAPVTAFTRIDDGPILIKTQIYNPDAVVILDPYVMTRGDVLSGIKNEGYLLVNTPQDPARLGSESKKATVDATSIAIARGLGDRTNPIINTSMIGALARITGLIDRESAIDAVRELSPRKKEENAMAAADAYDSVRMGWVR